MRGDGCGRDGAGRVTWACEVGRGRYNIVTRTSGRTIIRLVLRVDQHTCDHYIVTHGSPYSRAKVAGVGFENYE